MTPRTARFATLLVLSAAATSLAAPVDAPTALRAATAQLSGTGGLPPIPVAVHAIPVDATRRDSSTALWLVGFQGGGFAFIRGDDRLPPVAAWSAHAPAPWPAEHPALADWLQLQRLDVDHVQQVDYTHPDAASAWRDLLEGLASRDGEQVPPMLSCVWDQGWPWNQYCPADGAGPGGHVWAGCVATAMAQVMHFWQWPDMGAGFHSYVHSAYGTQWADFGTTTYDWASMDATVGTPAAALLQYHCGVAVDMDYAPSGSGAWVGGDHPQTAIQALKQNFRYPARARYITHQQYPGAAWGARLAQEILAGRPVLDSGYGSGGHAFVMDGLDNGYFHLNWGWSGWFNGWYEVEALTPGGMEFSLWQGAIVDLMGDTAPVVAFYGQGVTLGQSFLPMTLADMISDREDSLHTLELWVTADAPLEATLDLQLGRLTVSAPAGWTGSGVVEVCALDPQGLWSCGQGEFMVIGTAVAPRPVQDLRLTALAQSVRLDWTLPTLNTAGQPFTAQAVRVYGGVQPWFTPDSSSLLAALPGSASTWTDPRPASGMPRFYCVVVE